MRDLQAGHVVKLTSKPYTSRNGIPEYALYDAIFELHINHGKGQYHGSRIYADGRIEVTARRTTRAPHVAKGRLVGGRTVKMYRHQVTVKGVP